MTSLPVTPADVERAAATLDGAVVITPTAFSQTLSDITGARLWCKFENLQFTASFKERGARNFLATLSAEERARGVVTASAGNHAEGLARHARQLGITTMIVMPTSTPFTKLARTEDLGAEVVRVGADWEAAWTEAEAIASAKNATLVPPFDDAAVIAGQGTVALEMLDAVPDLEVLVVPVGGGGLISGMAVAAKHRRPDIEIIGVHAAGYPSMLHVLGQAPAPTGGPTIADGIAVTRPGRLTAEIMRARVNDLVVVSEQGIEEAIALMLEIEKTVVEGAGAAALAAVLEHRERFEGRAVGLVISGGNIDLRILTSVILRALARSGRLVRFRIQVTDRPGTLATVAKLIGDTGANIVDVTHHRDVPGLALQNTVLEVAVETRDRTHATDVLAALQGAGFTVTMA